jgi:hypothetical protein
MILVLAELFLCSEKTDLLRVEENLGVLASLHH